MILRQIRSMSIASSESQVALLFLATDGELPHEAAWRSWLRSAEGLLPAAQMEAGGLPPQLGLCAKALANSHGNPLSRQWLFSAYVHRPPDARPLPRLHTFHGREVPAAAQVVAALSICCLNRPLAKESPSKLNMLLNNETSILETVE